MLEFLLIYESDSHRYPAGGSSCRPPDFRRAHPSGGCELSNLFPQFEAPAEGGKPESGSLSALEADTGVHGRTIHGRISAGNAHDPFRQFAFGGNEEQRADVLQRADRAAAKPDPSRRRAMAGARRISQHGI